MNWKSTQTATWQVLDDVGQDYREFLRTTLEGRHDGICSGNLGIHFWDYALQKTLDYSQWTIVWSLPKSGGMWSFKNPWPNAFGVNMP